MIFFIIVPDLYEKIYSSMQDKRMECKKDEWG